MSNSTIYFNCSGVVGSCSIKIQSHRIWSVLQHDCGRGPRSMAAKNCWTNYFYRPGQPWTTFTGTIRDNTECTYTPIMIPPLGKDLFDFSSLLALTRYDKCVEKVMILLSWTKIILKILKILSKHWTLCFENGHLYFWDEFFIWNGLNTIIAKRNF